MAAQRPLVPRANREYLGQKVLPALQEALEALGRALAEERRMEESGELWDEDGYMPDDWKPLQPLDFLSLYFRRAPHATPRCVYFFWSSSRCIGGQCCTVGPLPPPGAPAP